MAQAWTVNINDGAGPVVLNATAAGLKLGAEFLLSESGKLVPHEEGTLERSGSTDVDEGNQRASIYYDTPYAVAQHERMDYQHDPGRQAKYLEAPMTARANRDTVARIIADEARKATA